MVPLFKYSMRCSIHSTTIADLAPTDLSNPIAQTEWEKFTFLVLHLPTYRTALTCKLWHGTFRTWGVICERPVRRQPEFRMFSS